MSELDVESATVLTTQAQNSGACLLTLSRWIKRFDHVRRKARVDLTRERTIDQNTLHTAALVRGTSNNDCSHHMRGEDACRLQH